MTRTSDLKAAQGYVARPPQCRNCAHLSFICRCVDRRITAAELRAAIGDGGIDYLGASQFRCGVGDFSVSKFATCSRWESVEHVDHHPV